MLRVKKATKGKQALPNIEGARENPSNVCKGFLIKCIMEFYESETTMSLDNKYVRYQEECLDKFKANMKEKMLDALNVLEWYHEIEKKGFLKFLENRVHNALWNAKVILEKYGKEYHTNDEAFEQVILKVDLFVCRCTLFAKRWNRKGS